MIRLLALDLDDTLLGNDLTISPANLRAVQAAKACGVHIALATARGWYSTEPYYRELGLAGYAVCGSGTRVYHEGHCVQAWTVPVPAARHILRYAEQESIMVVCSYAEQNLFNRVSPAWQTPLRPDIDFLVPDLSSVLNQPPAQLYLKGEQDVQKMAAFLPEEADAFRAHTVTYRDGVPEMMIIHPEANKATGLAWVCEQLGIGVNEVMAIGDSANDISMLRWAGIGVAMGWSPTSVQQAADVTMAADDLDGVATAIRRFILTA